MTSTDGDFDVLGVGLGPANLGVAVVIDELNELAGQDISAIFLDRRSDFAWHPDMLLPFSVMQVSYLKDLATQRNPLSRFTFLNYLHKKGRLTDFINMQTYFPSRLEFTDYFRWVLANLKLAVEWNTSVDRVDLVDGGCLVHGRRADSDISLRAKYVVLGVGATAALPGWAGTGLRRVFHNAEFRTRLDRLPPPAGGRVAVVGQGQSAAEVLRHLLESRPDLTVHCFISGYGMVPADDSPFANRVFDPEAVSDFYHAPEPVRAELLARHRTTNYGCVDPDLLSWLYGTEYTGKITGSPRLFFRRASDIHGAAETAETVTLDFTERLTGTRSAEPFDLVVCATGFTSEVPRQLLGAGFPAGGDRAGITLSRNYRIEVDGVPTPVFVVGSAGSGHGIGASLLSNVAIRSAEILDEMKLSTTYA